MTVNIAMTEFLVREWMNPATRKVLQDKQLFVTSESKYYMITKERSEEAPSFEEADETLLLHVHTMQLKLE